MEAADLDLIETMDLVEALFRRSHCGVVILTKTLDAQADDEEVAWYCQGADPYCLGLAQSVADKLSAKGQAQFLGLIEDDEDEDDHEV